MAELLRTAFPQARKQVSKTQTMAVLPVIKTLGKDDTPQWSHLISQWVDFVADMEGLRSHDSGLILDALVALSEPKKTKKSTIGETGGMQNFMAVFLFFKESDWKNWRAAQNSDHSGWWI